MLVMNRHQVCQWGKNRNEEMKDTGGNAVAFKSNHFGNGPMTIKKESKTHHTKQYVLYFYRQTERKKFRTSGACTVLAAFFFYCVFFLLSITVSPDSREKAVGMVTMTPHPSFRPSKFNSSKTNKICFSCPFPKHRHWQMIVLEYLVWWMRRHTWHFFV